MGDVHVVMRERMDNAGEMVRGGIPLCSNDYLDPLRIEDGVERYAEKSREQPRAEQLFFTIAGRSLVKELELLANNARLPAGKVPWPQGRGSEKYLALSPRMFGTVGKNGKIQGRGWIEHFEGHDKLRVRIFDEVVEPRLIQPAFFTYYLLEVSPLSRRYSLSVLEAGKENLESL